MGWRGLYQEVWENHTWWKYTCSVLVPIVTTCNSFGSSVWLISLRLKHSKCTLCPSINSRFVLTLVQITGSARPRPSLSCLLAYKLLDFRTMTNVISGHHDRLLFPLLEVGSFIIPMRPPSSVYITKWSELTRTLSFFYKLRPCVFLLSLFLREKNDSI